MLDFFLHVVVFLVAVASVIGSIVGVCTFIGFLVDLSYSRKSHNDWLISLQQRDNEVQHTIKDLQRRLVDVENWIENQDGKANP